MSNLRTRVLKLERRKLGEGPQVLIALGPEEVDAKTADFQAQWSNAPLPRILIADPRGMMKSPYAGMSQSQIEALQSEDTEDQDDHRDQGRLKGAAGSARRASCPQSTERTGRSRRTKRT